MSLQEIHDYLLQERGVEPELAFTLWINKVQPLLADASGQEKPLSSIT